MATGFTFCIPLKSKKAEEVVKAYLNHMCCIFGPSRKILIDNGTEFQNELWTEVFKRLKTEHRVTPKFLKACIGKQIQQSLEWDDLVWKAAAAYNFFLTESSGFSPFFLMFGHEPAAKHMILAEETIKYLGDEEGILNVQLMIKLFQVVAYNLAQSRTARDGNKLQKKDFRPGHIKVNHPVLVKDHTAKAFEPRNNDYIRVGFQGNNRVLVKDTHGKVTKVYTKDVTPVEMDIRIAELFNKSRNNSKIRDAQLTMPTKQIPDLGWKFHEDVRLIEPVTEEVCSLEPITEEIYSQEQAKQGDQSPSLPPENTEVQTISKTDEIEFQSAALNIIALLCFFFFRMVQNGRRTKTSNTLLDSSNVFSHFQHTYCLTNNTFPFTDKRTRYITKYNKKNKKSSLL